MVDMHFYSNEEYLHLQDEFIRKNIFKKYFKTADFSKKPKVIKDYIYYEEPFIIS